MPGMVLVTVLIGGFCSSFVSSLFFFFFSSGLLFSGPTVGRRRLIRGVGGGWHYQAVVPAIEKHPTERGCPTRGTRRILCEARPGWGRGGLPRGRGDFQLECERGSVAYEVDGRVTCSHQLAGRPVEGAEGCTVPVVMCPIDAEASCFSVQQKVDRASLEGQSVDGGCVSISTCYFP